MRHQGARAYFPFADASNLENANRKSGPIERQTLGQQDDWLARPNLVSPQAGNQLRDGQGASLCLSLFPTWLTLFEMHAETAICTSYLNKMRSIYVYRVQLVTTTHESVHTSFLVTTWQHFRGSPCKRAKSPSHTLASSSSGFPKRQRCQHPLSRRGLLLAEYHIRQGMLQIRVARKYALPTTTRNEAAGVLGRARLQDDRRLPARAMQNAMAHTHTHSLTSADCGKRFLLAE